MTDVQKISVQLPVPEDTLADAPRLRWSFEAMANRFSSNGLPLTAEEAETGWRSFTSSDGITDRYAVGWRQRQMDEEYAATRAAEMAACPYVACECGHHEDV